MKWITALLTLCILSAGVALAKQRYEEIMFNSYMEKAREYISYFDKPMQQRGSGTEERTLALSNAIQAWVNFRYAEDYLDTSNPILVKQHSEEMDDAFQKVKAYAVDEKNKALIRQYPFTEDLILATSAK